MSCMNELVGASSQRLSTTWLSAYNKFILLGPPAGEYAHTVLPNHCVWRNAWLATKECMKGKRCPE
jgi:hypothetical protein